MPKRPTTAPSFTLRTGESITFVLPVVPRTKKNHGSVIKRGKRKFHIPSEAYTTMEWQVVEWVRKNVKPGVASTLYACQPITQPLNCAATFYRDANRGDAVGYYQGLADALQKSGIIADDKWITQWDGSRLAKDATRSRIEVTLTAI